MKRNNIFKYSKLSKGFTLIELLVVVAIIGILSSVVVVSINAAREKSKASFIKSSLKSLYNEAELFYTQNGTYFGLIGATGACSGSLYKIAKSMSDNGVEVRCYSHNDSASDRYTRFGATAIIYDTNKLNAWSIDSNGIVVWDTQGVNSSGNYVSPDTAAIYYDASSYCALSGGRLPSLEELKALSSAFYIASGGVSSTPTSFKASTTYMSATLVPPNNTTYYSVIMHGDSVWPYYTVADHGATFRCVR